MKPRNIILAIFFSITSLLAGQKEAHIWYFGDGQGIDFNDQGPSAISDSFVSSGSIHSTICDSMGNEVLLSNGFVIRNGKTKKESSIPGLFNNITDGPTTLNNYIIQNPGNKDEYYIFSSGKKYEEINQQVVIKGSSRYMRVRFTGANMDSLILTTPAQEFLNTESFIAAYKNSENNFYWVAIYAPTTGRLYIHKLDNNGLAYASHAYWIDTTGLNSEATTAHFSWNAITFSSDGSKLAFFTGYNSSTKKVTFCDFDQKNGTISGIRSISDAWAGLMEFSYSGEFLYVTQLFTGGNIYQCRTQFSNSINLNDTNYVRLITLNSNYGSALIGPDRKIYLGPQSSSNKVGIIHHPDLAGMACGFDSSGITLNANSAGTHLPRYPLSSTFRPNIWSSGHCLGDSTTIELFNLQADSAWLDWGDGSGMPADNEKYKHLYGTEGTYNILYMYYRGGVSDTFNHTIGINYLNKPDLGPDTLLCKNSALILDASDSNADSYLWHNGATSASISSNGEGVYRVSIKNGACQRSDTLKILEVDCDLQSDGHCYGDTTAFQISPSAADSVRWHFGDGTIKNTDSLNTVHRYSDSGFYLFQATLYREGLERTLEKNISIIRVPIPDLGPDTLLCESYVYTVNAYNPDYSAYLWNDSSTGSSIQVTTPDTLWLRAEKSGCYAYDTAKVYFTNCELNIDSLCFGNTSVFTSLAQNMDSIVWETGDGGRISGNSAQYNYSQSGDFTVKVSLYIDQVYKNLWIPVHITEIEDPIPESELEVCENTLFRIDAPNQNYMYWWSNGTFGPDITFDSGGTYLLQVESNGCYLEDSVRIELIDCSCHIFIPNAFTPNNNGLNESFGPSISCVPGQYTLQIYNRWGQLLFESSDTDDYWDGTFKDKPCEAGVYVYVINYTSPISGVQEASKGTFLLLK